MRFRDRNRALGGQAYALTVFTPIRPGHEPGVRAALGTLAALDPFATVAGTHFARFVIVDRLSEDAPRRARTTLRFQYLLFSAVFDGDRDAYLRGLCAPGFRETANALWGRCMGAPRPVEDDPEGFARWMTKNTVDTAAFYAPYGEHTVADVRASLALRHRIKAFAEELQYAPASRLWDAFADAFIGPGRTSR